MKRRIPHEYANYAVRGNRRKGDSIKDGCTNVESTETGQRQCSKQLTFVVHGTNQMEYRTLPHERTISNNHSIGHCKLMISQLIELIDQRFNTVSIYRYCLHPGDYLLFRVINSVEYSVSTCVTYSVNLHGTTILTMRLEGM